MVLCLNLKGMGVPSVRACLRLCLMSVSVWELHTLLAWLSTLLPCTTNAWPTSNSEPPHIPVMRHRPCYDHLNSISVVLDGMSDDLIRSWVSAYHKHAQLLFMKQSWTRSACNALPNA